MGTFGQGLAAACGRDETGVLVWTPGMVQSYLDQTEADIKATGNEIKSWILQQNKSKPAQTGTWQHLWKRWSDFVNNWGKFYLKGSMRIWGGFVDVERAHAFRLRLVRWREVFERHGLRFVAAGPVVKIPGRDVLRDVLIGATGAAAAGVATYYTMKFVRKR